MVHEGLFCLVCKETTHFASEEMRLIYFGFHLSHLGLCRHLQSTVRPWYLKRCPLWSVLFQCLGSYLPKYHLLLIYNMQGRRNTAVLLIRKKHRLKLTKSLHCYFMITFKKQISSQNRTKYTRMTCFFFKIIGWIHLGFCAIQLKVTTLYRQILYNKHEKGSSS